jgi:WD40 repeat protein
MYHAKCTMRTDNSLNLPMESASILVRVFDKSPMRTESDISALTFSNPHTILTIEEDGFLGFWNIKTNQEQIKKELEPMIPLWRFNQDASLAAGASDYIHVMDVQSGEHKWGARSLSWVTSLAFSFDSSLLATGHEDGKVRLWNLKNKKPIAEVHLSKLGVSALSFKPDGLELAVATEDCSITLLETTNLKPVGKLIGHKDRIPSMVWSPDGSRLYSAGWDTTVRVWNSVDRKPIILLNSHAIQVQAIALSPDGKYLASADSDLLVRIWSTELFQEVSAAREMDEEVRFLAFSPNSKTIASGGVVHITAWDFEPQTKLALSVHPGMLRNSICVHPVQNELLVLNPGNALNIWNIDSIKEKPFPYGMNNPEDFLSFALSKDGEVLAGSFIFQGSNQQRGNPSGSIALWDYHAGKLTKIVESSCSPATSLAFSPCGKFLASGGVLTTEVCVWNLENNNPSIQLTDAVDGNSIADIVFVPDANRLVVAGVDWLATSGKDGQIALWDLDTNKLVHSCNMGAFHLAISVDAKYLACALVCKQVMVLNLQTFEKIAMLCEFQHSINSICFSPDGKFLAASSEDQQVRFWSVENFSHLGTLTIDFRVKAIAFGTDSNHLFALGNNDYCCQYDVHQFLGFSSAEK